MTVETDERTTGVECEGKIGLNLNSPEDLSKLDSDCNGVVHVRADQIDADAKDDADGSYVFVDGADMVVVLSDQASSSSNNNNNNRGLDTDRVVADSNEALQVESSADDKSSSELNAGSMSADEQVHVNELGVEEGKHTESLGGEVVLGENVVSSSGHHVPAEASECISNGDKVEQIELDSSLMVEGNQEPVVTGLEAVLPVLQQLSNDETLEVEKKLEAAVNVEENSESPSMVTEAVESEPRGEEETAKLAEENLVEEPSFSAIANDAVDSKLNHVHNAEANVGENSNSDSSRDAGKNQESQQPTNTGDLELELHQIDDVQEKVEQQSELDPVTKVEEDQGTQVLRAEFVESELHQLVNEGERNETEKEASKEEPSGHVGTERDLNLESSTCPVDDSLSDEEATDLVDDQDAKTLDTESVESYTLLKKEAPVEEASEPVVIQQDLNLETAVCPDGDSQLEKEAKDVEEDHDTQILGTESVGTELQQLVNGDKKETEQEAHVEEPVHIGAQRDLNMEMTLCPIDDSQLDKEAKDVQEDQDTQILGTESVESELHQLVNGDTKETEKEAPEEEPPVHIGAQMDLNSDTAMYPVDDSQSDKEGTNGAEETEASVSMLPVRRAALELNVLITSDESQEIMHTHPIDDTESDSGNVNVSVENSESLSCIAGNLNSENNVGDKPIESEDMPTVPADCGGPESETGNSYVENGSFPSKSVDDMESETEDTKPSAKGGEIGTTSLDETNAVTELGNASGERGESMSTCSVDNMKPEAETGNNSTESNHSISTILVGDAGIESEAITACAERDSSLFTCPDGDAELESEVGNSSPPRNKDIRSVDNMELESVHNGSAVNNESMPNCANDVIDAEHEGDGSTSRDSDGKAICAQDEGTESNGIQPDDSTNDALEGQEIKEEVAKRPPFRFLIRIPRYVDDKIREEIRLAQLQVDEKTQSRDAIRAAIQSERATCSEYRDKFEAARSEERAARDALNAKRQELDSVQSVINRMKNANSIDEIGDRIHTMEHMIEHETMPLKEEKQLIREIKQLKNLRDQLSSSLGKQTEEQPTLEQRDKIEERFKLLKRELDSARKEVLRFEGITKAARKIYFDENEKLRELQSQFRAADDLRQEAYTRLHNLRKELYDKNKYFRMYKDNVKKAEDFAFAGVKEELHSLCVGQVETVMELWNSNEDFRNEYIRCNTISTLRRLRTLDGRSLGPDEEPPVLHNFIDEKVDKTVAASPQIDSMLPVTPSEQGRSIEPREPQKAEVESLVNLEQKNQRADAKSVVNLERYPAAKSKKVSKPAALETGTVTNSGREEVEVENKQREEELARKAEELRKEKEAAAAKLKEQRRLEEKAKAKEAEERKKRNAEKAQAKAELRAKKEAEVKEKEREKRARKKERKVAAAAIAEGANGGIDGESAANLEAMQPETATTANNTQEQPEAKEKASVVTKRRAQKPLVSAKVKALPPPLRNRGRRRMQPWMWVLLTALVIVASFLVGNSGYSSKFSLPSFGF